MMKVFKAWGPNPSLSSTPPPSKALASVITGSKVNFTYVQVSQTSPPPPSTHICYLSTPTKYFRGVSNSSFHEAQLLALSSPSLLSTLLLAELYQGSCFPTAIGQPLDILQFLVVLMTPSLFWLNNIPLCIYDTFSLSIFPLMAVSRSYTGFPQMKGKQGFNDGVGG